MDVPCMDTPKPENVTWTKEAWFYIFMETNVSKGVGEHFITFTYLSVLTDSICGWSFKFVAAVAWLCMDADSGQHQGQATHTISVYELWALLVVAKAQRRSRLACESNAGWSQATHWCWTSYAFSLLFFLFFVFPLFIIFFSSPLFIIYCLFYLSFFGFLFLARQSWHHFYFF
jgi:hypothetical protein